MNKKFVITVTLLGNVVWWIAMLFHAVGQNASGNVLSMIIAAVVVSVLGTGCWADLMVEQAEDEEQAE